MFFQDYKIIQLQSTAIDPLLNALTEGVSQVYLTGRGDRSYFDMRAIHYYGYSQSDFQGQLPTIHPVIDYDYTFDQPVLGGELGTKFNLTSLSRDSASFDPISLTAQFEGLCSPVSPFFGTADTAYKTRANCLLRGMPGTYSRASAEVHWKYQYIDPLGQVWTPFASLRGDAASMQIENQPGVSNFINPGDLSAFRIMPTVGLEYHYPFIGI